MGALIDYWYYTGDDKYNDIITQGMLFQVGPGRDYMTPNQTLTEGNDDQGFWGMAAMSAAEYKFPNPAPDQPQWLALAQAVFNTQAFRWDTEHCGGGLRWQIFTWNNGWNYKNSISQACFFNLAARLALYTGNASYAAWADKTWDWMVDRGFIDAKYNIFDGAYIETNCTVLTLWQFSYNPGAFLLGAAALYNYSMGAERDKWQARVRGLVAGVRPFFNASYGNVMQEVSCEDMDRCNTDQLSFKAYLSRWMAATTKWAPFATDKIMAYLRPSAVAAAKQCVGGANKRMCGFRWTGNGTWDGTVGLGQQMSAMEVVLAAMIHDLPAPVTNVTGGTSRGDPGAGGSDIGRTAGFNALEFMAPITAADKAGAYLLTVTVLASLVAGIVFMFMDETADKTAAERWSDMKERLGFGAAATVAAPAAGAVVSRREDDGPATPAKSEDTDRSESDRHPRLPSPIEDPDAVSSTAAADQSTPTISWSLHWQASKTAGIASPAALRLPTRLKPGSFDPEMPGPTLLPPPAISTEYPQWASSWMPQGGTNGLGADELTPPRKATSFEQLRPPSLRQRDQRSISEA